MTWKGEKQPYKIWVSEIILQQTRVEQGLLYYNNFIEAFPTLESLALAADEAVFKLWEGLGYYSRCKNLLHTARYIHNDLGGKFPEKYDDLLQLKGIGGYTAAAIASFAYGLPHAVVDGNVYRVLSRYMGNFTAIDSTDGKKYFHALADQALDKENSAHYNQAIMDFGATVCKPMLPTCNVCVLNETCKAFLNGWVNQLPLKVKKITRKNRVFYYFIFSFKEQVFIRKREQKDIWQNLYEFYLFESEKEVLRTKNILPAVLQEQLGVENFSVKDISPIYSQQLTHQNIKAQFIRVHLDTIPKSLEHFKAVTASELATYPFPKVINMFLTTSQFNNSFKGVEVEF